MKERLFKLLVFYMKAWIIAEHEECGESAFIELSRDMLGDLKQYMKERGVE